MSRITSGWRGANRILVAMLTSRLRQRDRRRHANLVAEDSRGVALARRVLDQPGVAGAEDVLGAVAQADLELAGEDDDELAAWGRMPVEVLAERPLAEQDLRRCEALRPLQRLSRRVRENVGSREPYEQIVLFARDPEAESRDQQTADVDQRLDRDLDEPLARAPLLGLEVLVETLGRNRAQLAKEGVK